MLLRYEGPIAFVLIRILTHEAGWESHVGSDFAVDLDGALLHNLLDLISCDSIFESVS